MRAVYSAAPLLEFACALDQTDAANLTTCAGALTECAGLSTQMRSLGQGSVKVQAL